MGLNDNGFEQDAHVVLSLPFDFTFYGETHDQITVCSNGWLAMGDQDINECWNTTIPHQSGPEAMIAPFWDDLYQPSGGEVWQYHDAAGHRFIVEWSRLRNQNGGAAEVFEVILLDPEHYPTATGDGEIVFQYHTVTNSDCAEWQCQPYATVSIEAPGHVDGLSYSFWGNYPDGAATLAAGRAIRFIPYMERDLGYISGSVTNASAGGIPVTGAEILVLGSGRSLFTSVDGVFFGSVPVDTCDVIVTHPSFAPDTAYAVEVTKDDTTVVNFSIPDIAGPDISGTTRYPLTDDTAGPYVIDTHVVEYSGIQEATLFYRVDLGVPQSVPLSDQGAGDYRAEIPGQPLGSRIDYYIYGQDIPGLESTDPQGAPGDTTFVFHVAPITTLLDDDFEAAGDWSGSGTASTGQWDRVDPNATWSGSDMVQPEDDHTPSPGVMCYITGQSVAGAGVGDNDVDGGYTRLTSGVLDLPAYSSVILNYYRWYTNDAGNAPGEDYWQVDVTGNGTTWVPLENTNQSDRSWLYQEFDLADYINLTSTVQIRFVAEDGGSGSIVEAGVDDVLLQGYSLPQDTEAPAVSVQAPNGGELLEGGMPFTIRWDADDNFGIASTRILLSTDGGATYPETIAHGVYDSTYVWSVLNVDEPNCRIRVLCLDGSSNEGWDVSDGGFEISFGTGIALADLPGPATISLEQNRPNPFNPVTEIRFGLPRPMSATLRVYNVEGRLIRTLVDGIYQAGFHTATWFGDNGDGVEVSSGIYFYRLETREKVITRKMLMLK
ncbi:MAG: T9SS type A sorting domain-containing protein [Candidatus Eisenbacteria sp.]|nr:T9SS type A sorting domain-containing protein [Candidatus Eisenbacteria bacterium]